MQIDAGRFTVRLATSEADVAAAQRLRYEVFVEEMNATPSHQDALERRERDRFDPICDHLLLIDRALNDSVIGVYRLLRGSVARQHGGFYTATEFNLDLIAHYPREALELGRSCVAASYRGGAAMHLLWMGVAQYVVTYDLGLLFGCASFHGTDLQALAQPLAYLYHHHLAPEPLRVRALAAHYQSMDLLPPEQIDRNIAMRETPALIKGYLRLGGFVGDGLFIDREFNTVDLCLVMDADHIADRHRNFYSKQAPEALARILG